MNHYSNIHPLINRIIRKKPIHRKKNLNFTLVIIDCTSSRRRIETIVFDIAVTND